MTTLSPSRGIYWLVYRKEVGSSQFEEKWGTQREYLWTPEKNWNFSKLRWGGVNPIYCVCVLESKRRSVICQLWWSLRSATSCTFVMVPSCNAGRPAAKIGQANGLQALFLPRPSNLLVPDGPHLFLLKYSLWNSLSFPTSLSLFLSHQCMFKLWWDMSCGITEMDICGFWQDVFVSASQPCQSKTPDTSHSGVSVLRRQRYSWTQVVQEHNCSLVGWILAKSGNDKYLLHLTDGYYCRTVKNVARKTKLLLCATVVSGTGIWVKRGIAL